MEKKEDKAQNSCFSNSPAKQQLKMVLKMMRQNKVFLRFEIMLVVFYWSQGFMFELFFFKLSSNKPAVVSGVSRCTSLFRFILSAVYVCAIRFNAFRGCGSPCVDEYVCMWASSHRRRTRSDTEVFTFSPWRVSVARRLQLLKITHWLYDLTVIN